MVTRRRLISGIAAGAALARIGQVAAQTGGSWRNVAPAGAPGERWDHTLSASPPDKLLMLAFGRNASGAPLGDCWVADRSTGAWERLDAEGPSPRFGHAVATDDETGLIYLYGGQSDDHFYSDLWILDLKTGAWEQLADGANGPAPRYGTSLVFDGDGTLFVSHGFTFDGRFDDTWAFDLATGAWEDRSPDSATRPLRRCLHEAIWNPDTQSMWLFGGCSSGYGPCPQGDLWTFTPQTGQWTEVAVAGPTPRSNPSLTFDRHQHQMLLFGGLTDNGAAQDLWTGVVDGDTVIWNSITTDGDAPSPRSSHDAVLSGGALYLFGGTGPDGALGDLWRFKLAE